MHRQDWPQRLPRLHLPLCHPRPAGQHRPSPPPPLLPSPPLPSLSSSTTRSTFPGADRRPRFYLPLLLLPSPCHLRGLRLGQLPLPLHQEHPGLSFPGAGSPPHSGVAGGHQVRVGSCLWQLRALPDQQRSGHRT